MKRLFLIAVLALFLIPLNIKAANVGDACQADTDCAGYICVANTCQRCGQPGPSSNCTGQGGYCQENGLCGRTQTSGGGVIDACQKTEDCLTDGQSCIDGFCQAVQVGTACNVQSDCGKGQICSSGKCANPPTAPSDPNLKPFEPVLPSLQIKIPGVQFSNIKVKPGEDVSIPWIMEYIQGIYKYLLGVAIFLAIIMISIAGFRWLTAGGNASVIGEAKKQITNVIIGLLLAFGVTIVLETINPQLINLRNIQIKTIAPEYIVINDDAEADIIPEGETHPIGAPTWNYQTFDDNMCAHPPAAAGVADPKTLITYNCPGVEGQITSVPEMKDSLCRAGTLAQQRGYTLVVKSTYRSFDKQVAIWCGFEGDCKAKYSDRALRKRYCAVPGYSNHGLGRAVDVVLKKDGKQLFYINSQTQCQVDAGIVAAVANIFYDTGSNWKRYDNEIWHFEYGTNLTSRSQTTGYPPKCGEK